MKYLIPLLMLLSIQPLFSQEDNWFLRNQAIRDLPGPYITVLPKASDSFHRTYILQVVVEEDTLLGQLPEEYLPGSKAFANRLTDKDKEPVRVNNWPDMFNGFRRQGWRLVETVVINSGGEDRPITSTTWFILEKIQP